MRSAFVGRGTRRRRVSAVLAIALALVVADCGSGRSLPVPQLQTVPAAPTDPYIKPDGKFVAPPVSTQPLVLGPGQTVVSITFDDGRASQTTAARMMNAHGVLGTFYVNSGTIGMPGHLSLQDLESIATSGNEIGGHSLTHPMLPNLPRDEIARQICDDRDTLLGWGFAARNFAYPFDATSPETMNTVRECGYNSARGLGNVHSPNRCGACDFAEDVPPPNPMRTKAPAQVDSTWTTADVEKVVTDAASVGGWLQLTFHDVCPTQCNELVMQEADFDEFLTWLATQRDKGNVLVRTVGDVIGGPVQPAVAGPVALPAPAGVNGVKNPGLAEQADGVPVCWMQGRFGTNSPEFSLVPNALGGTTASRLVMRNHVDGDAKLLQTTDLGACAPAVSSGQTYTIQAWYTSTVPTQFSVQYRLARGIWVYGTSSPKFAPAIEFTPAHWKLPPIAPGVTAVSFGLTLAQNGELVTADYSLTADSDRESPH